MGGEGGVKHKWKVIDAPRIRERNPEVAPWPSRPTHWFIVDMEAETLEESTWVKEARWDPELERYHERTRNLK